MDYNFHTHTPLCGHATGTEEEYVLRAIEGGIRVMGFSDHIPFRFPDGYEATGVRVPVAKAEVYRDTLCALREKYTHQIELHIGFESEYYRDEFSTMVENARTWGAEYLILGQHYVRPEHPNGRHCNVPTDDVRLLEEYADSLVEGIRSGIFTYVAHPDMFRFTGEDAIFQDVMRRVCVASRECGVPLEINFYGIRDHRHYPRKALWEIVGQEHAPVTFGFDAHDANGACDLASLDTAMALVNEYTLNYIGKPTLIQL